jgi:hypothetical protein
MSQTAANAYAHPRLNELLQRAAQLPFIGQLLINTVRDLVHPQDRVLICYPVIETSGATAEKAFTYYSIDVVLVTAAFYIRILFYPKTHTCIKKRVHMISDVKIEYPAPPMEELAVLQSGEFLPSRIKLEARLVNDKAESVDSWMAEASDPESVRLLVEINRQMGRMVGLPLSQCASGGVST